MKYEPFMILKRFRSFHHFHVHQRAMPTAYKEAGSLTHIQVPDNLALLGTRSISSQGFSQEARPLS